MIHVAEMAEHLSLTAAIMAESSPPRKELHAVKQLMSMIRDNQTMLFNSEFERFADLCLDTSLYVEAMLVAYKEAPRRVRTALIPFGERHTRHHYQLVAGAVTGITRLYISQTDESLDSQLVIPPALAAVIITGKDNEPYETILLTSPGLTCAQGLSLIDSGWAGNSSRHYLELFGKYEPSH